MKHFLLLFCLVPAIGLADTDPVPPKENNTPVGVSINGGQQPHAARWVKDHTKKGADKIGKVAGMAASVAVIPVLPVFVVWLSIHCQRHDCGEP